MKNSISHRKKEIVEEFSMFDDWMDKYEFIIELGKELAPLHKDHKTEENLIKGCQSQVWLMAEESQGELFFLADSDAIITKGLVAIVVRVFSGAKPQEIIDSDMTFLEEIGLHEHLSPNRSNGLKSMIKQMKLHALSQTANGIG